VRNSILLIDFTRNAVRNEGMSVIDAAIYSCEARTRPIAITAFALIGGSLVIITDPIFKGMAVSLVFGGLLSTLLTLLVVPLGCISAAKALSIDSEGNSVIPPDYESESTAQVASDNTAYKESFFDKIKNVFATIFGIIGTVVGLLFSAVKALFGLILGRSKSDDDDWTPSPPKKMSVKSDTDWTPSPPKKRTTKKQKDDEWVPSPPKKRTKKANDAKPATKTTEKSTDSSKPATKPKTSAKSKVVAKPKTTAKSKAATKPKATTKPKTSAKSKAATKPKVKQKSSDTTDTGTKTKPSKRRGIRLKKDI